MELKAMRERCPQKAWEKVLTSTQQKLGGLKVGAAIQVTVLNWVYTPDVGPLPSVVGSAAASPRPTLLLGSKKNEENANG